MNELVAEFFGCDRKQGFRGCMPIALNRDALKTIFSDDAEFAVSFKLDGKRALVGIVKGGRSFAIGRNGQVVPFLTSFDSKFENTLFDCEIMGTGDVVIFDAIGINGKDCRSQNYPDRLKLANYVLSVNFNEKKSICLGAAAIGSKYTIYEFGTNEISVKPIFYAKRMSGVPMSSISYSDDGMIYVPIRQPYGSTVFKWKEPTNITVDFEVILSRQNTLLMAASSKYKCFQHSTGKYTLQIDKKPFTMLSCENELEVGNIYECAFRGERWVIVCRRTDKTRSNATNTLLSTLDSFIENIGRKELEHI
jgi:hypothetical protein